MRDLFRQRLSTVPLPPDVADALLHLAEHDTANLARHPQIVEGILAVQRLLGDDADVIAPFRAAWLLMYAAIRRLDQLQDDDPVDDPLPLARSHGAQYNLVFATYLLAASALDRLAAAIPSERVERARQFWSDSMLRMAAGQQHDLAHIDGAGGPLTLAAYQALVQAKTGATFALAFGGAAMLLTDDTQTIRALTAVGEIYGTLIQYGDDIADADRQPDQAATLPHALRSVAAPNRSPEAVPLTFWSYLYPIYRASAAEALAGLPPSLQAGMLDLFRRIFEEAVDKGLEPCE